MEIQATVTLTLTKEQLLTLLVGSSPEVVIVPAPVPAPAPAGSITNAGACTQPLTNDGRGMTAGAPCPAPAPVQQTPPAAVQQIPPAAAPCYSVQDLMLAARPLVEAGRQQELLALLAEFGVPAVTNIPENRRADFAARLRAIGGKI